MDIAIVMTRGPTRLPDVEAAHPSAERIAAWLDERLPGDESDAITAHLADCAVCRVEVREARSLMMHVPRARRRLAIPALGAIAAALALVMVPRLMNTAGDGVVAERGTGRAIQPDAIPAIAIVSPADGDTVSGRGLTLTWRADTRDAEYRVALQDATGRVLWSTPTTDTVAAVPADVELAASSEYFWTVDALRADGRSATSRVKSFFVR